MIFSSIKNPVPITLGHCKRVSHVAFDGYSYYFTVACDNKIIQYNMHLCMEQSFNTSKQYNCICYDFKEHCFWASVKDYYNCIFKLDCCMNEIDCIVIQECLEVSGVITGISYNCCTNSLLISFPYGVVEVNKSCGKCTKLYYSHNGVVTGVLSICPGYIFTVLKEKKQYIYILNQSGKILDFSEIDCYLIINDMVFNPCSNNYNEYFIDYLIIKKGCYPYIYKQSISIEDLGFKPCYCNYKIYKNSCCHKPNYQCSDPYTDIMESVAFIETALSHILNAEGEKLQKVLSNTNDIDEIICVNKEINKTIVNINHLEQVLYAKLQAVSDNCSIPSCCDENNICTCIVDGGSL